MAPFYYACIPSDDLSRRKPLVDLKPFPSYVDSLTNKMLAYIDRLYIAEEMGKKFDFDSGKISGNI